MIFNYGAFLFETPSIMDGLQYRVGDATNPQGVGNKCIIHCCNNRGKWGAGFVMSLSRKWPHVKDTYLRGSMILGDVTLVQVTENTYVANIIGQNGYGRQRVRYVNYEAIRTGFQKLRPVILEMRASVHGPRLGSGLAGGEWSIIEQILIEEFVNYGISVTIYDL
jgi:hypothetical protein